LIRYPSVEEEEESRECVVRRRMMIAKMAVANEIT